MKAVLLCEVIYYPLLSFIHTKEIKNIFLFFILKTFPMIRICHFHMKKKTPWSIEIPGLHVSTVHAYGKINVSKSI